MTDNLAARLRIASGDACRCGTPVCLEAADRIEQLETKKKELKYLLSRCVAVLSQFQNRGFYQFEPIGALTPWGLETLDMANIALRREKKDD